MATANPAMSDAVYLRAGRADTASRTMTVQGTVVKTGFLLALLLIAAAFTWTSVKPGELADMYVLLVAGSIGGLIVALVTIFVPRVSPFTSPVYAVLEGLVLGAISAVFEARYPGIALQAVGLSAGTLVTLLVLYGTGVIRATEKFKIGVVAATGAVCLVYLADLLLSLFGVRVPYIHESGLIGIGFSAVVVVIAALNLILDFDFIEQGVRREAPKYMEWYGGFSLLVTLVWMYLEILRLLSKLRGRD